MLLLLCILVEPGVCCPKRLPGARLWRLVLALANIVFETDLRAVDMPRSAKLFPEDDR